MNKRIKELVGRVGGEAPSEVILATSATTCGEATALAIAELLRGKVTLSRIACGLARDSRLGDADEVTLTRALEARG